jgi:hypothetical protein
MGELGAGSGTSFPTTLDTDSTLETNLVTAARADVPNDLAAAVVAIETYLGVKTGTRWWTNVKAYGATGDGSTDDTTAIQNALNAVATAGGVMCFFPAGHYKFTKLYLHYDASNNPGWPNVDTYPRTAGRIILQGSGMSTSQNISNNNHVGTTLESTDATGPAIECDGSTNVHWLVQMRDLSVVASNTTKVVFYNYVRNSSGFDNVFIYQEGAGDGLNWIFPIYSHIRNLVIEGAGIGTSLVGAKIYTPVSGSTGGELSIDGMRSKSFNTGIEIGHPTNGSGKLFYGISARNLDVDTCTNGLVIGHSIAESEFQVHAEDCTTGVQIQSAARGIRVHNSRISNCNVGIAVGHTTDDNNRYKRITLDHNHVGSDAATTDGIAIYPGSNGEDVTIYNYSYTGQNGSDNGLNLDPDAEDVAHNNVRLINAAFTSAGTEIVDEAYLKEYNRADETLTTASPTLSIWGVSIIDSSSNAVDGTLPDGPWIGYRKHIVMTNATNSSTVSVTNHETSDPEVFTFAQVYDYLTLQWMGTEWKTIENNGVAV